MYKLIYETPEGKREVSFDEQPSASTLADYAFTLRHRPQLCALVKPPVKEAPCV